MSNEYVVEYNRKQLRLYVQRVQVIKLSDAVQSLPRQVTCFVHGVPPPFLEVGRQAAKPAPAGQARFSKGAYFVGRLPSQLHLLLLPLRFSINCTQKGLQYNSVEFLRRAARLTVLQHEGLLHE